MRDCLPFVQRGHSTACSGKRLFRIICRIAKCIAEGKITYSNGGCPDGAKLQAVTLLHQSAGFVTPLKESLADLAAKRKVAESSYTFGPQVHVMSTKRTRGVERDVLDKRVAKLDAMAREPHSAAMAD